MVEVELREVAIDAIEEPNDLPVVRSSMDEELRTAFAADLAEAGVVEPIKILDVGGKYVLIDGKHRLEAVRAMDRPTVKALVYQGSPFDAVAINLRSNVLRGAVTLTEKVRVARRLVDELGLSLTDAAKLLGVSRGTMDKYYRIARSPDALKALEEGASLAEAYRVATANVSRGNIENRTETLTDDDLRPVERRPRTCHVCGRLVGSFKLVAICRSCEPKLERAIGLVRGGEVGRGEA